MKRLVFLVLAASTLFAQGTRPQPLGLSGDRLYETTAEFRADNPNCFLPKDSLPVNYKVSRYRNNLGDDTFDCLVKSANNDPLHLLGFSVREKSTVIENDHIAAIFYRIRRADYSAIKSTLHDRLGEPTEVEMDGYRGDGDCKGDQIHWSNDVSDIVLIDECDDHGGPSSLGGNLNLFYTRRADLTTTNPSQ
jgi:hypothetical protein